MEDGAMLKKTVTIATLCAIFAFGSCLYQNNPLQPNRPPEIVSYTPDSVSITLIIPDSCSFSVHAVDPDGDQVNYAFLVEGRVMTTEDTYTFHATSAREYEILAEARDAGQKASHEWHVLVRDKNNRPPAIIWWFPEQRTVACAVGDTIEFHIRAEDEHPEQLRYSYYLDSQLLHTGSPDLINRFMQRGEFLLEGVAFDGQYADTVQWNVTVTGFPDTIAPAAITDLTGSPGQRDGAILIEWTAPGDDGEIGSASAYMVRTSTYPILTEQDWKEASSKTGEPRPSPAGTREFMTIENLVSANYVYVAMRASDDFFNVSPLGNCAKVLVRGVDVEGTVVDAETGQPLAGIYVSNGGREVATGDDGHYSLLNIPSYSVQISARDEKVGGVPGAYFDVVMPLVNIKQIMHIDFNLIPVCCLRSVIQPDWYQGDYLRFFKDITQTSGDYGFSTVYKGWNHWPVKVYTPPMIYKSVDLQAYSRGAMAEWEDSTGIDLFVEVPSPELADAVVQYDSTTESRHNVATSALNPDGTPAKRLLTICFLDHEAPIELLTHPIFTHEFGHILGPHHSRNPGHLLVGLTSPEVDHVTTDEANLVRILYRFPCIFDSKYILGE